MVPYVAEQFTDAEADVRRRYVTNLDGPVFALVNLPEVVKGALFARYSRSPKSLRRLFLDEFVDDLDVRGDAGVDATMGVRRAEALYDRAFGEYGDDSVAQLGGVHLACEQSSNLLTKVLERGRLMSYLEQSTRYIGYDTRLDSGHYRYYRDPDILSSALGARYVGDMDRMFDTYAELLPVMTQWLARRFPLQAGEGEIPHRRAVRAKALDALRGLLPAGSLSNVGIFGSGQGYEQLLLRMRAHPLPEARRYGELMLGELRKVIPSFLSRLDRPERGGQWATYLEETARRTAEVVARLWPDDVGAAPAAAGERPGAGVIGGAPARVTLLDWDPDGERKVVAAACYRDLALPAAQISSRIDRLSADDRAALLMAAVGDRRNRRHRPGRAFEHTSYRFEVVCDYGAFRDLQRHRLLTIEWQALGPALGADVPELVTEAGLGPAYAESLERSAALHDALVEALPEQAAYAVALAFKVRFTMLMNAREAMHLLELRSGREGHPAYRSVAQQMHRLIDEQAGHHAIAAAMRFVDHEEHGLERLQAEQRQALRRGAQGG